MQKLGEGAKPFTLAFPQSAPNSVLIRGEEGDSSTMGVSYEVRLHIGDSSEDHGGSKKNSVHMSIRKVSIFDSNVPIFDSNASIYDSNVFIFRYHFMIVHGFRYFFIEFDPFLFLVENLISS